MNAIQRRLERLERQDGLVTMESCLHFVDKMSVDFPGAAPTTLTARENLARDIQRRGGPVAFMRGILDEIDGCTAQVEGVNHARQ
ncbi:hypothetical protein [Solidesulfovibrio sp.]